MEIAHTITGKVEKNNVKNRFLPLSEAVAKGQEPEAKFSDFSEIRQLGSGSFGKVYLVKHKKTRGVYAIKAIDKRNKNNQEGKPYFRREIEIMYKVHHPNVVRLFSHFEDDEYCYFVMEYISKGNLYDIMSKQKSKCFEARTVASYMRDLISAVYYLHKMETPIVHRDIKPENILLHEDGRLKLTDFGWSNYIDDKEVRTTYCGTPVYLAPEMIKEIGHDEHLDIWCIGVLMFELLTGEIPFPGNNMTALSENILRTKINWPRDINLDAKDLISRILKPDPQARISLMDMLKHPFFTKFLTNPTEFLFTPLELEELQQYKPHLLTADLPTGYTLTKKKIKIKVNEEKKYSDNLIDGNIQINHTNTPLKTNVYTELNSNIKELYDKLKIDYEALANSYNELVLSKSEVSKKIEDLSLKEIYFKTEKESLIKEIDERDNEKLNLHKIVAELNHKIMEKENNIRTITKTLALLEEKRKRDEEEIEKLNTQLDIISISKDQEIKEYKEKIMELQKKLMKDDNLENQISNLRDSISGIGEKMSLTPNYSSNSTEDSMSEYRRRMEIELRETKEYLANEMESLRREMAKEREKYNLIIKNKEDEIKKLNDEKSIIKENEAKKYEKITNKYELTLKLRESEVENLKVKLKKYENIIEVNKLKK